MTADIVRRTICDEAAALQELADSLCYDDVEMLMGEIVGCRGNVIFTGVGKSYIAGKKISASLASIGVRTFGMTVSDISHGGLGSISDDDLIVAISNSGETPELNECMSYISKVKFCKIASITGNRHSTLSGLSSVCVEVRVTEAGRLKIVPTSSTLAVIAIGDAIVSAIVQSRNMSVKDFAANHPGGTIGKAEL